MQVPTEFVMLAAAAGASSFLVPLVLMVIGAFQRIRGIR